MTIVPITLRQARWFIQKHHRHNKPPRGCAKFAVGLAEMREGKPVMLGVATAGRPVARALDEAGTLEINRTCTDGTANANSMLYGACIRAAWALGYRRCITYTQEGESGASLRAVGMVKVKELPARADWADSSVKDKALREPAQASLIDEPRARTGGVARVLWEIRR